MAFFNRGDNKFLFVAEQPPGNVGWAAYVLPEDSTYDRPGIELPHSFYELKGSYVFSYQDVDVEGAANADLFVLAVREGMRVIEPNRAMMWLIDYADPEAAQFEALGFSTFREKTTVSNALTGDLSDNLILKITNGCLLTLDEELQTITIAENGGGKITFNTVEGLAQSDVFPNEVTLPFTGQGRGVLQFGLFIRQGTDFEIFDFGLKFFSPDPNPENKVAIQRYSILRPDSQSADDRVGFSVWADFSNTLNSGDGTGRECLRTFFAFTGQNRDGSDTVLQAAYLTAAGHQLDFLPWVELGSLNNPPSPQSALMVLEINPREGQNRYLVPQGNFRLKLVDTGVGQSATNLLCGLSGTETIVFQPADGSGGDQLRFVSHQRANAPVFPFPQASPTGPPMNPDALLLDALYLTAWATVVRADGQPEYYVAQPKGASLFGLDKLINPQHPSLLGPEGPGYQLPDDIVFPMPPYASVKGGEPLTAEQIEQFDRQVISPTRRSIIGPPPAIVRGVANTSRNVTTPSGIIAKVSCDANNNCEWDSIELGYNNTPVNVNNLVCVNPTQSPPPPDGEKLRFDFLSPNGALQQAFQSSSLFMVAANACNLGKMTAWTGESCPFQELGEAIFQNQINIEDWVLAANVGVKNYYDDYYNVLIVKGRQGMLWDPDEEAGSGLVQNPDLWTQRSDFSSPTYLQPVAGNKDELQPPDPNQQVILSQWLQDYFREASRNEGSFFKNFNKIVKDPNWTGILMLRVDISCLPKNLSGILAGVREPDKFNAHHFGINVSPVKAENVSVEKSSSMFGLINYVDSEFNLDRPDSPVQPTGGETYDFITLSLQVLFENTAIKNFSSFTQLTLNELFDERVHMDLDNGGNRYNTIILRGTYQNNNGQPVYRMSSASDNNFLFDSNVLDKVEMNSIQMSTRDSQDDELVTWFAMSGFINYKVILYDDRDCPPEGMEVEAALLFDVFSYGESPTLTTPPGLAFSNLGLQMAFSLDEGRDEIRADVADDGAPDKRFEFVIDDIYFDPINSTPRPGSLATDFILQLESITRGTKDDTPTSRNYLPVATAAPLAGVDGGVWWGLRFKLDLGSPGALAGDIGLNSYLLVSWSPESEGETYRASVGIQLPGTGGGASLISLQNVLKLSIGQIWLNRARQKTSNDRSWMLLFSEIALKFLGMLKIPPGGTSTFYLFGNPEAGDLPSGLGWYAVYRKDKSEETTRALEGTYSQEGE